MQLELTCIRPSNHNDKEQIASNDVKRTKVDTCDVKLYLLWPPPKLDQWSLSSSPSPQLTVAGKVLERSVDKRIQRDTRATTTLGKHPKSGMPGSAPVARG